MNALKSAGAVFAAFLFVVVTSTVTDAVMHGTGVFPPMDAPPMQAPAVGPHEPVASALSARAVRGSSASARRVEPGSADGRGAQRALARAKSEGMSDALFGFAFAYRTVFTVLSGTLAARLAPGRPMAHAVALGVIGTLAGTAGAVATWDMGLGPRWYPVSLAVEALPCVLLGAWAAKR